MSNESNVYAAQPPEISNIGNLVNAYMSWASINGPPRSYSYYHPSEWGYCLRKQQYKHYVEIGYIPKTVSPIDGTLARLFDTGHWTGNRWVKYFQSLGVVRGLWRCKNPLCQFWNDDGTPLFTTAPHGDDIADGPLPFPRLHGMNSKIGIFCPARCCCGCKDFEYNEIRVEDKELNIRGHVDQVLDFSNFDASLLKSGNPVNYFFDENTLPKTPFVNDMKTINSNGFGGKSSFVKAKLPKDTHLLQVQIYINLLDLEYGTLIYENKDNSEIKVFKVERMPKIWEKIREQALELNTMTDKRQLPPPRPLSQSDRECKDCEFQSICHTSSVWNDPNLDAKRRKFYGLTIGAT